MRSRGAKKTSFISLRLAEGLQIEGVKSMFEKIKAKLAAKAKEEDKVLLKIVKMDVAEVAEKIERAVMNGIEHIDAVDEDLAADLEKFHADAKALEAKLEAKLAAEMGKTTSTSAAADTAKASVDGNTATSEKDTGAAKTEPEAATSEPEASKS
jgi:hypothetical protein